MARRRNTADQVVNLLRQIEVGVANAVDCIAGGAQEREGLWLWSLCAAFWPPRIGGFGHNCSHKPPG